MRYELYELVVVVEFGLVGAEVLQEVAEHFGDHAVVDVFLWLVHRVLEQLGLGRSN
jgi:hypothetical protein